MAVGQVPRALHEAAGVVVSVDQLGRPRVHHRLHPPVAVQPGSHADMIGVEVRDHQGVDAGGVQAQRRQAVGERHRTLRASRSRNRSK